MGVTPFTRAGRGTSAKGGEVIWYAYMCVSVRRQGTADERIRSSELVYIRIYVQIYTHAIHVMCPSINPHFLPFGDHSSYVCMCVCMMCVLLYMYECMCVNARERARIVERTSVKKISGEQKYRRGSAYVRRKGMGSRTFCCVCFYY